MPQKYALLIGNSDYQDKNIANLKKSKQSVDDLAEVLKDPDIGNFPAENITIRLDQSAESLMQDIAHFFADKEGDDLLLLYFTGHGFRDANGELYLVVRDTEKDYSDVRAVSASFIADRMGKSRAKRQLLILDCCFSGAFKAPAGVTAPSATVVVLTASDQTKHAWEKEENREDLEHSIFTHHLIQGLKTGEADSNRNGTISTDELYDYIRPRMKDSKQMPRKLFPFIKHGNIIIAKATPPPLVEPSLLNRHHFFCYAADGEELAGELYEALKASDVPVWLDKRDVKHPGPEWNVQVLEALKTCHSLLFLMTRQSVTSRACACEWKRVLRYKKPVIPIQIHHEAEIPFELEGRQTISFTGTWATTTEALRQRLAYLETPAGKLELLQERFADAQRALRQSTDQPQKDRAQADINQLQKEITDQERIAADPQAAEERVKESIERGLKHERQPEKSVSGGVCHKFINPPPSVAPTYFQDRYVETKLIVDFLNDDTRRLMIVAGRSGIGKTAMVCRLLKTLESGQLPDNIGTLSVDSIVYLSAVGTRKINVPHLYAALCKLLPSETAEKLDNLYRDRHVSTEKKMTVLLETLGAQASRLQKSESSLSPSQDGIILLLDNFEDVVDPATRNIIDSELDNALKAILSLPHHPVKIIITTRVTPKDLMLLRPERQTCLLLDEGLKSPYAENILREMDVDGRVGLKDAPDDLLEEAKERTRGYPRALEALFAILAADRDTRLNDILADAENLLPENVVEVLVGEAFSRLDTTAQQVMQALAIYARPVTLTAVDYLLKPYLPGVNSAPVLNRLVNIQFVRKEEKKYYLHPVDRAYALARIPRGEIEDRDKIEDREENDVKIPPFTQFALYHRGAEYFKQTRKPRKNWKTLDDLMPQLAEIELHCAAEDYDTAANVLLEIDFDYLKLWGHYQLMIKLHELLQSEISVVELRQRSLNSMGVAYYSIGQARQAITCYNEGLSNARERKDQREEGVYLNNLGLAYTNLGQTTRAIKYHEQALAIHRKIGDYYGEGTDLGNLGNCYAELGQTTRAIEYHEQALAIHRKIDDRYGEGTDLGNLGNRYAELGQTTRAIEYYEQALVIDRKIRDRRGEGITLCRLGNRYADLKQTNHATGYYEEAWSITREIDDRYTESFILENLGGILLDQNEFDEAIQKYNQAIQVADEISLPAIQQDARLRLALAYLYTNDLPAAWTAAEAAQQYDQPQNNHNVLALSGVIALRKGYFSIAQKAFRAAIVHADKLLDYTAQFYSAMDAKGLALCGSALCKKRSTKQFLRQAIEIYQAARQINSDAGIVGRVLRLFDALAVVDKEGILSEVRAAAGGV